MKNNIALGILGVAVAILYILHFCEKKETSSQTIEINSEANDSCNAALIDSPKTDSVCVHLNNSGIAYVNMDTLLEKYKFAKDVNARLLKKEKDARAKLSAKDAQLRSDYAKVQDRVQRGLLNQADIQAESERFMKQQQELVDLDKSLTNSLLDEQKKFNKQLHDSIMTFFKEYNAEKHYEAIFSNTSNDNIIYAEQQLNITTDVVDRLNARYKK